MPATPALEVQDLVVSYGGRTVVDHLSLRARSGAVTAVLGPNGAGKTTTLECAEGLRSPGSGTIRVLGHPAGSAAARERTGVMLQDGGLPMARSVLDVLTLACAVHGVRGTRVADLVDLLDLHAVVRTPVRRLSGGQRQRLAFAVAIVATPDLAFLDEPSAGLDPHARHRVWTVVRALRDAGTAVVLTTHLLEEAAELADVVHVMAAGRIVASGTPHELVARHASNSSLRFTLRRGLSSAEQALLATVLHPAELEVDGDALLVRHGDGEGPRLVADLARWCADHDAPILTLRAGGGTLEHAYLALTGERAESTSAGAHG